MAILNLLTSLAEYTNKSEQIKTFTASCGQNLSAAFFVHDICTVSCIFGIFFYLCRKVAMYQSEITISQMEQTILISGMSGEEIEKL